MERTWASPAARTRIARGKLLLLFRQTRLFPGTRISVQTTSRALSERHTDSFASKKIAGRWRVDIYRMTDFRLQRIARIEPTLSAWIFEDKNLFLFLSPRANGIAVGRHVSPRIIATTKFKRRDCEKFTKSRLTEEFRHNTNSRV